MLLIMEQKLFLSIQVSMSAEQSINALIIFVSGAHASAHFLDRERLSR